MILQKMKVFTLHKRRREWKAKRQKSTNIGLIQYVFMYVFNFFRDAILISYTAGLHEGRLFSYLQVYKKRRKN